MIHSTLYLVVFYLIIIPWIGLRPLRVTLFNLKIVQFSLIRFRSAKFIQPSKITEPSFELKNSHQSPHLLCGGLFFFLVVLGVIFVFSTEIITYFKRVLLFRTNLKTARYNEASTNRYSKKTVRSTCSNRTNHTRQKNTVYYIIELACVCRYAKTRSFY